MNTFKHKDAREKGKREGGFKSRDGSGDMKAAFLVAPHKPGFRAVMATLSKPN